MKLLRSVCLAVVLAALSLAGCASTSYEPRDWSGYQGEGYEYFQKEEPEYPLVNDPLERTNRVVGTANRALLLYVADPISSGWRFVVPQSVRSALERAALNLEYPIRLVNNLLQARWRGAGVETARFLTNTTIGIAGLFDPAKSWWGLQPSRADMGQTFAAWGWTDSTFLALPLFGPSTLRDGLGTLGDMPLDPTFWFFPAGPVKIFVVGSERIGSLTHIV